MTQGFERTRRLVSPPAEDLGSLRQSLTPGERLVYEFFDRHLPRDWEIYIQPHLNGLRPDFVLLHPLNGIAVFEVKDWNLGALKYSVDWHEGRPRLMGSDGSRTFLLEGQNPVRKIELYKKEIFELYCPRLREGSGFGIITAGVIFPFTPRNETADLLRPFLDSRKMTAYPHLYPLIGADTIAEGNIEVALPRWNSRDYRMSADLAADLRGWLPEPSFVKDQRSSLDISKRQRELIMTRTDTGYRRIKGSAGSGKSIVLAAKAAELASTGRNVLVCTFNITLINYLRDVSVRWKGTPARNAVTWLNFHYLCKRMAIESGHEDEYNQLWHDDHQSVLDDGLADLLLRICGSTQDYSVYDAILVDEGQDFRLKWWQVLRRLLKPGGEMVLVADRTQDVYGTAGAWTDEAMANAGFRGQWFSLDVSYRMPPKLVEVARRFAEAYLPDTLRQIPVSPTLQLDMYPCSIKWQQTSLSNLNHSAIEAILELMRTANPQERLAVADITVIVDSIPTGKEIADRLKDKHAIKSIDTFRRDESQPYEERRKKLVFFMGDARIKITTIHSFKGWESRLIVLIITKADTPRALASIYTGLTRLKRSKHGTSALLVVSSAPELEGFAKSII